MKPYILAALFFTIYFPGYSQSTSVEEKLYLYYLHGAIVESQGLDAYNPEYGKYEYLKILEEFESKGFIVKSEIREKGTDVHEYASKLAIEIRELIDSGVSPNNITVLGASKGSLITMLTSTRLQNPNINFVLMASCNDWVPKNYEINLCGRILSIFEESDQIGKSCQSIFSLSKCKLVTKEIELHTGKKHGFLFKPLPEWIEPTMQWAKSGRN